MIPAKFDSNWPSSIREDDFVFDESQNWIVSMVYFVWSIVQNLDVFVNTFHTSFLQSVIQIGKVISEERVKIWNVNNGWLMTDIKW